MEKLNSKNEEHPIIGMRKKVAMYLLGLVISKGIESVQIAHYEQQEVSFKITLTTGQIFDLILFISSEQQSSVKEVSSREIRVFIAGYLSRKEFETLIVGQIVRRIAGFELEKKVENAIKSFMESDQNSMITAFRIGSTREDRSGKDFILTCRVDSEKSFEVPFDLKLNEKEMEKRIKNNDSRPAILTNFNELNKDPDKFIDKIQKLITLVYKKTVLKMDIPNHHFQLKAA